MKWSLYIGKVSGIKIFIHWTFIILVLFIIQAHLFAGHGTSEILLGLAFIGAIFVCITLHELGHALAAKRYHFKTLDINLLPIGGLARMEGLPEKPMQEFVVAIMGPLVNVIIGLILFFILKAEGTFPSKIAMNDLHVTGSNFWYNLFAANLFLAVFNLIPAFPMDGGRILRALLSFRLSRAKATRIAARTGQFIAILFVFLGFFGNVMLIFIGLFIFLGAQAEFITEEIKSSLEGIKVSDVMMHRFSVLSLDEPLSKAISLLLDSQEQSFIVKEDGQIKGSISLKEILSGLSKYGEDIPVGKVMQTEIPYLQSDTQVQNILQYINQSRQTLIPVYKGDEFAGVLDLENISEYISIQDAIKNSKM